MIPQFWVPLDKMPLTTNGKLNKKALPILDKSELINNEYTAPRTEIEEQLVTIWQDVLGVERVGVYDNFFELGGHSLLIAKLKAAIKKTLVTDVEFTLIFEQPTIAEFAAIIDVENSFNRDAVVSLQ